MKISFENTESAFEYKTDEELKNARLLFATMGVNWLVKLGTFITPAIIKLGLPVKWFIKKTIFKQFVGGETLAETSNLVARLGKFHVQVILDYGVEGKEGESSFEHAAEAFVKVIEFAATQPNIPFISVKLTAFARFSLLEKLHSSAKQIDTNNGIIDTIILSTMEKEEWTRVEDRLDKICATASKSNTGVLIDAEESWIQSPVDALTTAMMRKYNQADAVVFNTIQLYRDDRLEFLKENYGAAKGHFYAGFKLVRGAYMEKERKRAEELVYPSPIQPDKRHTDEDYNLALKYCLENINGMYMIVATHNEKSNLYATQLMEELHMPTDHEHVHFSQLYGMSDNITFNLAKAGYCVSKYLPFGPIKDVIPYLMRRAQENSSMSGQTGREYDLIKAEIKRRNR